MEGRKVEGEEEEWNGLKWKRRNMNGQKESGRGRRLERRKVKEIDYERKEGK